MHEKEVSPIATLLERLRQGRTSRYQTWKSTPLAMRVCFYTAVFAIFASIGALVLLMGTAYLSPLQIVLNILISGGFAIAYIAVSFWQRYWLIPVVGIVQGCLFAIVAEHYPATSQLVASGSPLNQQLHTLSVIGIVSVATGYVLFVVFFARQGARYFRAHNEIAMAAEIHRALVPPIHRTIASFEVYGISIPSGEVGGDLVDVAEDGSSWIGYVADISGHGLSAGLLMAMFKTAVRTRAKDVSSGELLTEVHRALYPLKTPNMFATVGVLQWTGRVFNLALAGHLPLLHYLRSNGEVREYPASDLPLGVLPEQTFSSTQVACQPGDVLLMLSDGLTEVFNKNGKEMGIEPVRDVFARSANQELPELSACIRETALNFGKQEDDQTLLIIRCL
jgi:serine phosphatase RsbU (regulator of sigma subunit)